MKKPQEQQEPQEQDQQEQVPHHKQKKQHKHRKLKVFLGIVAVAIVAVVGYVLISGWLSSQPTLNYDYNTSQTSAVAYPDAQFAVISDLHTYDNELGTTGSAFEEVLYSDRKLLTDSVDLLDYAIDDILKSDVKFVLISGDMTKDGEKICHELVAGRLKRLTDAGIKVYVIPGNHDINNPGAESYSGDVATPVENITADEFAQIYANYGYNDAIMRDTGSLSYVAEPEDGLWLLALDTCRYEDNQPGGVETVGGRVSQETADWIAGVLKQAADENKAVIVMMHHGVVEHWNGQHKLHPDYLIEDYQHFGQFLASYNVRIAFTGHYHAQDITLGTFDDNKYLYDVETGSLITAPCPIRYCSIKDNTFTVESNLIVDKIHPGTDFAANATAFVKTTVKLEAQKTLESYFVKGNDEEILSEAVSDAFVAHYAGDENPALRTPIDTSQLSLWGRFILFMEQYVIDGLWQDLPPADNNASFSLD